jgi:hypothetical protein
MDKLMTALLMLAICTSTALADNFRCPNGAIVSTGDRVAEVYVKCDPPTFRDTRTESDSGRRGSTILINVEEWTYNEGPNRLMHQLVFYNGILSEIHTLGYGK